MTISCRLHRLSLVLPLVAIVYGCGTTVETQPALGAETVPDKPLSSITDHDWEECQQLAERSIKGHGPGPGLGDTGERAASTYGGALGAIIALISAKSRSPGDATAEQQEQNYYLYWNTMKNCLRSKGFIVPDDSDEVERP